MTDEANNAIRYWMRRIDQRLDRLEDHVSDAKRELMLMRRELDAMLISRAATFERPGGGAADGMRRNDW